ncbi:unnamed protein product [Polarella glacialis]|uniref:Uncharacterized protein n=1 Tax=Polarella glacialis TaxID=89957 RepID=A0A813DS61_POLGL|nr:unnamed protein product [Polarella glacialis]CAE8721709.1 unnamed protein product [Polarella glacialis]
MCVEEKSAEEAVGIGPGDEAEPDAEPTAAAAGHSHPSGPEESPEPEAEAAKSCASSSGCPAQLQAPAHPHFLLPQSHLRCVRCLPQDQPDELLGQATYMRWLADPLSVPILRRMGESQTQRRVVAGSTWLCAECGLRVNLLAESLTDTDKKVRMMAEAEMQLTYRALDHCTAGHDSAKLMELWPLCERVLGPWHGVTLFCAMKALPSLSPDRAYKVRARLALVGVDDTLTREIAR